MVIASISLDEEYGYVILSGVFSAATLFWLGERVAIARKRYNVPLPHLYADLASCNEDNKKHIFNCYQRGHQNALETYSQMLAMLFVGGLKHPIIASSAAIAWSVGRILYAVGYSSGNPNKRHFGAFQHIAMVVLLGTTISTALSSLGYLK